ncbi:MAG TPA: plastocyanin/azurin family copper-binding protein [Thermomicrobiales bacterium]|jgi:plastocyanin
MRRLLVPLIAAFVLVFGLGTFALAQDATPPGGEEENACAAATPSASPSAAETEEAMVSPTAEASMASPSAEEGCEVRIENFAFSPATIQVSVGDTVTWENYDDAPHTVTGDNNEFDSGQLAKDQKFTFTFTTAGTITYHCNNHPNMHGTIVVS